jgi:hypothetical protein
MNKHSFEWVCTDQQAILTETAGLTLRLQQADDITLTDWSDDVSDNRGTNTATTSALRAKLGADLSDTTTGASASKNLDDAYVYFLAFLSLYDISMMFFGRQL